jgi:signal transduction histidine kinase
MAAMAAKAAASSSAGPTAQAKQPRNPISRRQIETVVSRSVAIFGLVFGAQTFPSSLAQFGQVQPIWNWVFIVALYGGLLASVAASMARRGVRFINVYIAVVFLLEVVLWPLIQRDPSAVANDRPWLWFLVTVATATAAVAFSTWVATGYLVVAPVAYGIVRVLPSGGDRNWGSAGLDVAYAIILGAAVLIIITLLRQASSSVDNAQSTALDRYAHAVRQHATELERVQVDSIVHDSVLTTLLSAARAYTPEAKVLATSMAQNAMGHLKDAAAASPDDDAMVSLDQLAHRIMGATATLSAPFELRNHDVESGSIPVQSAEAVYSAAVQAMVNSLQHSGGADVQRWLAISGLPDDGIQVDVGDTGAGFSIEEIPVERLGLRVSIIERVANAGGQVEVDSAPGEGTIISIRWPHPDGALPTFEPVEGEQVAL